MNQRPSGKRSLIEPIISHFTELYVLLYYMDFLHHMYGITTAGTAMRIFRIIWYSQDFIETKFQLQNTGSTWMFQLIWQKFDK